MALKSACVVNETLDTANLYQIRFILSTPFGPEDENDILIIANAFRLSLPLSRPASKLCFEPACMRGECHLESLH
jgi:hypothetical protein